MPRRTAQELTNDTHARRPPRRQAVRSRPRTTSSPFARRALKTPGIGHTGTLDPLATGLLVLLVGHATRLSQFLVTDEKEYLADVRLGHVDADLRCAGARTGATARRESDAR